MGTSLVKAMAVLAEVVAVLLVAMDQQLTVALADQAQQAHLITPPRHAAEVAEVA
jgi:hypothetical protein